MLTTEQINNLKKGDKLLYNNNGRITEWEVDYPKYLINEKKQNIVYECKDNESSFARQVAVEAVAGGGECINKEYGCVRVSIPLLNGRGQKRFSMLISDWANWSLPESETGNTGGTDGTGGTSEPTTTPTSTATVVTVSPINEETDISTKPSIQFTFSGAIKPGSGQLKLIDTANSSVFTTISAIDTTQVKIVANILQVFVAVELNRNTEYEVQIDPGFVVDSNDLPINILGSNTYKFTTQA